MTTVEYSIGTGAKSDFYTLWKTVTVDLRPTDKDGNITEHFRLNGAQTGNMYYHVYFKFVQNLAKDKNGAISKATELGVSVKETDFFELKHQVKPSFNAFGTTFKYQREKWVAPATSEFFEMWKNQKDLLKSIGWTCWKYEKENKWYMALKDVDAENINIPFHNIITK